MHGGLEPLSSDIRHGVHDDGTRNVVKGMQLVYELKIQLYENYAEHQWTKPQPGDALSQDGGSRAKGKYDCPEENCNASSLMAKSWYVRYTCRFRSYLEIENA